MNQLLDPVVEIIAGLGTLVWVLLSWLFHWWVAVAWFAWWLWGVDWARVWPVLARGAWAVVLLLMVIAALAWSELAPRESEIAGLFDISNFWWHLGAVTVLVVLTLFCGWLQSMFRWAPTSNPLDELPTEPAHAAAAHH